MAYDPFQRVDFRRHPLVMSGYEFDTTAYQSFKIPRLKTSAATFEDGVVRSTWKVDVQCPKNKLKISVR